MKSLHVNTLTAASFILTASFAQGAVNNSGVDHYGIYVGADYGLIDVHGTEGLDQADNASNIYVGAQFGQIFSVEVGYIDFGEYGNNTFDTQVDGYTLGLKAGLPVNNMITIYAKGGQLWWQADLHAIDGNDDINGSDIYYGVGASFALSDGWGVRLEYTRFDLKLERNDIGILADIESFDSKLDYTSIGIQHTF